MENTLCVAIGDFDGVHLGHKQVILAAVNNKYGHIPAVFTFKHNCKNARLITDNQTKTDLIYALGIEKIILDDFSKIKKLTPEQFIKDVLIDKYGVGSIICGTDFRFGKNASGDVETIKELSKKYKLKFESVDQITFNDNKLSSSNIRELISDGEIEKATEFMGHTFSVNGKVIHGKKLATENNTPTVNIEFKAGMVVPAYGVYVTKVIFKDKEYAAISNVGVRPSVEKAKKPNIETHILDFNDNLYGENIKIEFLKMIRPEIKFKNKELLFEQINYDIQLAKTYFNGEKND